MVSGTFPVIFITARQDTESVLSGFRNGAVDYIHKPFHLEEVLSRIETHLQIGRLTRELRTRNEELETEIARRREAGEARRTADERYSRLSADEALRWGISGFVGESRTVRKIVEEIKRVYRFANTSVLIQGEWHGQGIGFSCHPPRKHSCCGAFYPRQLRGYSGRTRRIDALRSRPRLIYRSERAIGKVGSNWRITGHCSWMK
jgi:hypothetical protein